MHLDLDLDFSLSFSTLATECSTEFPNPMKAATVEITAGVLFDICLHSKIGYARTTIRIEKEMKK